VALCTLPTLVALLNIRPNEIDYQRARRHRHGPGRATRAGQCLAWGSAIGHLSCLRGHVSLAILYLFTPETRDQQFLSQKP